MLERRPLIGITTYYVQRSEINDHNRVRGIPGEDMTLSPLDYSRSVEAAGGVPVLLPVSDPETTKALVSHLDGLLLAGGEDVDPLLYKEKPEASLGKISPWRDGFEWNLAEAALEQQLPIFGICRGFQLLNVVLGGSLVQDLASENAVYSHHTCLQYPKEQYSHEVLLTKDSRINTMFEQERIWVNSFHHQGIKALGEGLMVTGRSEDGLVEAFEGTGANFLLAVQWHPETFTETKAEHLVLFQSFVTAAKDYAQQRRPLVVQ